MSRPILELFSDDGIVVVVLVYFNKVYVLLLLPYNCAADSTVTMQLRDWRGFLLFGVSTMVRGTNGFVVSTTRAFTPSPFIRTTRAPCFHLMAPAASENPRNAFDTEKDHLTNQAQAFDGMAPMFANSDALPPEMVGVYKEMASRFLGQVIESRKDQADQSPAQYRLLDIGCGAGVLFRFLLEEANKRGVSLHITGVDVSQRMISLGLGHAKRVLGDVGEHHSIDMVADDFCRYLQGHSQQFDGAIANSCFANFWDPDGAIEAMAAGLKPGGVLCVAHPVGSDFVRGLNEFNPHVTPHLMPTETEFEKMTCSLKILDFSQELQLSDTMTVPWYYASAAKVN